MTLQWLLDVLWQNSDGKHCWPDSNLYAWLPLRVGGKSVYVWSNSDNHKANFNRGNEQDAQPSVSLSTGGIESRFVRGFLILHKESLSSQTMSATTLTITESQTWIRLDLALSQHFGLSRNFFQHLLERGEIRRLGEIKVLKKSYICKLWDTIEIANMNRFDDDGCLAESPKLELPILYETSDYAVIYKPKWVYSHPTSLREIGQSSVVGFLYHHYGSMPSIGNFIRAGLLHRLDRETDWVMIVALSEAGLAHFRALFHDKSSAETIEDKDDIQLKKWYRCTITPQGWDQELERIGMKLPYIINSPVLANVPWAVTKDAISIIHSIQQLIPKERQLELEILTWRTHQIRIHCANVLKSPIKWDTLYGNKRQSWPMMLTAFKLSFLDPTWQTQTIELLWQRHDSLSIKHFVHNWQTSSIVVTSGQSSPISTSTETQ